MCTLIFLLLGKIAIQFSGINVVKNLPCTLYKCYILLFLKFWCFLFQKSLDLEGLAKYLAESITERDYRETRHNTIEDDGLKGLINLMCVVMKHNLTFKCSAEGKVRAHYFLPASFFVLNFV